MSDEATRRLHAQVAGLATSLTLRAVEDADGPALTALIGSVFDEYACGPLDPVRFDADLALPHSASQAASRRWWVVTHEDGAVVASVAHGPLHEPAPGIAALAAPHVELHRLYLAPEARGRGLASVLLEGIAREARLAGASLLTAWSDTRLVDAHRRYLASGFDATGETRELGDPAGTTELLFVRLLPALA
jgi:GNAT superfamily N-acetyltransferase